MNNEFYVKIGADVADLVSAIKKAGDTVNEFVNKISGVDNNAAFTSLGANATDLSNKIQGTTDKVQELNKELSAGTQLTIDTNLDSISGQAADAKSEIKGIGDSFKSVSDQTIKVSTNIGEATSNVSDGANQMSKSIEGISGNSIELSTNIKETTESVKELNKELGSSGGNKLELDTDFSKATKDIQNVTNEASKLGSKVKEVGTKTKETSKSFDEFKSTGSVFGSVARDTDGLSSGLGRVILEATGLDGIFDDVTRQLRRFKSAFNEISDSFSLKGAINSITQFSTSSKRAFIDFYGSADKAREALSSGGGFGGTIKNLGLLLKVSFAQGVKGANLLKAALISTGIGALVVALASIVAYWEDIKGLVNGVSGDLVRQRKEIDKQADSQNHIVDLLNASDNILKLQGKTQAQINKGKIKELGLLLGIQKEQQENLRQSLSGAQKQEKTYIGVATAVRQFFTDILKSLAETITGAGNLILKGFSIIATGILNALTPIIAVSDAILGKNLLSRVEAIKSGLKDLEVPDLTDNIQRLSDAFAETVIPDKLFSKQLEKDFKEIELAAQKTQNTIAGLQLQNIDIGIDFNVGEIDSEIAKIQTSLKQLKQDFSEATTFEAQKSILAEQFEAEQKIIALNNEKKKQAAKGNAQALKQIQEKSIAELIELTTNYNANAKALDVKISTDKFEEGLSTIKLKVAEFENVLKGTTDYDESSSELNKKFAIENQILEENYKKQKELAEKGLTSLLKVDNDYGIAKLKLAQKQANERDSLYNGEITEIKRRQQEETNTKIEALKQSYGELGSLSQEQLAKYNADKAILERQGQKASLENQYEFWQSLIDLNLVQGDALGQVMANIQAKIADINNIELDEAVEKLSVFSEETTALTNGISSAFTSLGNNIANSLSQSAGIFGTFVATIIQEGLKLLSNLIATSIKSAAVIKAQAAVHVAAEQTKATASAVSAAAQTAASSGPGAAVLLPILIAGAVAVIGSAFAGIGGKSSSGGGASYGGGGASSSSGGGVSTSYGGGASSGGGFEGRVIFEIGGDKLIGVLNNTSLGNLRVGDSDQLITTG